MILNRKSTLLALMLGAVIGCAGEEGAAPAGGGPVTPPGEKPSTPAKKTEPGKEAEPAKTTSSKEMTPAPAQEEPKTAKPADGPKLEGPSPSSSVESSPVKLTAEELAAIKELPAAEQAVAIQQAVCPVSSHHLGSMEKPVKVSAEGRTFYLCCEGCEPELKKDAKAVVAKLDQSTKK
jgi:hypothetical protein